MGKSTKIRIIRESLFTFWLRSSDSLQFDERTPSKKNPEGKKIPDFCAQKSQTRGLVWVTRGPIETIFVKKFFKIRVNLRQNFLPLLAWEKK